jgi:hypothetical protein
MVEDVKELSAELDICPLTNGCILEHRKIEVVNALRAQARIYA